MTMVTLAGVRAPRLRVMPDYARTWGPEVVDLAALAGLDLDPWQCDVLDDFCAESPVTANQWNALECVEIVPRQNGKGGNLEAYVLGCLYLFEDPLIMYSAHLFATAREMFIRIKELITGCSDLSRRVKRINEAHGKEGIELITGQRLLFHARSNTAGRGFSGDKNILDEAFKLDAATMSAIMPTMSARKNPQIVYASSSGWQISQQLGKLRRRALRAMCAVLRAEGCGIEEIAVRLGVSVDDAYKLDGKAEGVDPSLAFLEFSVPETTPIDKKVMADRALWAVANPAYLIRITERFVETELRTMDAVEFARERLGIGDYPADDEDAGWDVIPESAWSGLADTAVKPSDRVGPIAISAETTQDRSFSAIGVAFRTADGVTHVEVDRYGPGATWVVPRLLELRGRYGDEICALVIDKVGAASSFVDDLEEAGEVVVQPSAAEVTEAFGQFYDGCVPAEGEESTVRHLDQPELNDAVAGAQTRLIGDRRAWDRKAGPFMPPLVAVTLAAWGWSDDGDPLSNIW